MDDRWKDWLPLAGVAVGWGLNQCGQWFVFRRDERKAIGRALTDLMEVRHRLLAIPKAVEMMAEKLKVPADAHPPLRAVLGALFPPDEGLAKRFEESVSLVSGMNPILGFRLRSQDVVGPLLQRLRTMALHDSPQTVTIFAKLEDHLVRHLSPHLEILIRELAWEHGWWTWWKARRRLRLSTDGAVPEEFWEGVLAVIPKQPEVTVGAPGSVEGDRQG
jgi:hypothetical protein